MYERDPDSRRMGTAGPQEREDFRRLLDAVMNSPGSVPELVRESPELLHAVDNAAETVLHWLSVENHVEGVRLLFSLGAEIPKFALIHAIQLGNVETVNLLFSLGARLNRYSFESIAGNPVWGLSEERKEEMKSIVLFYQERPN